MYELFEILDEVLVAMLVVWLLILGVFRTGIIYIIVPRFMFGFTLFAGISLSKCDNCGSEVECNFHINDYHAVLVALQGQWIGLYHVISSIFHISNDDKQIIEDHSSSTAIRCLDVLHRVYHRGDELNTDIVMAKLDDYEYVIGDVD